MNTIENETFFLCYNLPIENITIAYKKSDCIYCILYGNSVIYKNIKHMNIHKIREDPYYFLEDVSKEISSHWCLVDEKIKTVYRLMQYIVYSTSNFLKLYLDSLKTKTLEQIVEEFKRE